MRCKTFLLLILILSSFFTTTFARPTIKCMQASLNSCQDLGALGEECRRRFPDQCQRYIQVYYQKSVQKLPVKSELVKDVTTGEIERKNIKVAPDTVAENFEVKNSSGGRGLSPVGASVARYQIKNDYDVDPVAQKEYTKREIWALYDGVGSCEEFAYEHFPYVDKAEKIYSEYENDLLGLTYQLAYKMGDSNGSFSFGKYPLNAELKEMGVPLKKLNDSQWSGQWYKNAFVITDLERNFLEEVYYDQIEFEHIPALSIDKEIINKIKAARKNSYGYKKEVNAISSYLALSTLVNQKGYTFDSLETLYELQGDYQLKVQERTALTDTFRTSYHKYQGSYCLDQGDRANYLQECDQFLKIYRPLVIQLKSVDDELQKMLEVAVENGCIISPDQRTVTPCDISPSVFKVYFNGGMKQAKEIASGHMNKCHMVADEVSKVVDGQTISTLVPKKSLSYMVSNSMIPSWLTQKNYFDTYYIDALRELKKISTSAPLNKAKYQAFLNYDDPASPEGKELGNKIYKNSFLGINLLGGIGGGFTRTNNWKLADYKEQICHANYYFNNGFSIYAKIFGFKFDVISVDLLGNTGYDKGNVAFDFEVLETDFAFPILANSWGATTKISSSEASIKKRVFNETYYISVFGVPIKLRAKAYLEGGAQGGATKVQDRICDVNGGVKLKVDNFVMPYATAYAKPSVSVGFGVEIGVKGYINLAKISQINGGKIDLSGANDYQTKLSFRQYGDLHISWLDGYIKAYIDYFFSSSSKKIFTFDGFSETYRLFEEEGEFNLYQAIN